MEYIRFVTAYMTRHQTDAILDFTPGITGSWTEFRPDPPCQ